MSRFFLFDWDNTLVESWTAIHGAWNATLADFGLPLITLAEIRDRVRLSAKESFPALFGAESERAIRLYRQHYQGLRTEPEPLQAAESVLKFCQSSGISCGVISNKSDDFLQQEIAALGWQSYFPLGAVGAGKAPADKPDPLVLQYLMPAVEDFSGFWYIGDTGVDLEFAQRCGMIGVLIGDNVRESDPEPVKKFPDLPSFLIEIQT